MAMCMTATTVVAGPWGSGITAFAADTAEAQKTVTISAYDYTAVEAGLDGASETGVIMEQKETVDANMSNADLIKKAFEDAGVEMEYSSYGNYVSSINGLDASAGGGYSGWMMAYNNDDYSNGGIDNLTLSDGDVIRFDYTHNEDTTTDDIGVGYYGKPIVTKLQVADSTITMSKTASYGEAGTYYIDGEKTDATGTQDDPFVFEVEIPADEAAAVPVTVTTSLNSHYAIIDGWSASEETYDLTNGLDFSVSSLGGKSVSYFEIKNKTASENPSASYEEKLDNAIKYIANTVKDPAVGSVGGEWAALALARYGYKNPEWYTKYYNAVVEYVETKGSSKLHNRKSTDNSRVIIGLTAIGADPTNVHGYNLLAPLADQDYVVWQGINGSVYALIALDTGNYEIPKLPEGSTATQTTREGLIKEILSKQVPGGGWAFSGSKADPDMTTMTIQSLAPYYKTNADVREAVDKGMKAISAQQRDDGGLASWGTVNSESCAQTVCGLSDLGRDAATDVDFVKNGNSVLDALLGFYDESTGGFAHAADRNGNYSVNQMATEQATYALVGYDRYKKGKNRLYDMSDREVLYTPETGKPNISKVNVVFNDTELIADGTAKEPAMDVYYGDIKLTEGKDYTKEFSDNVEVGTAKVTITAMGDYDGVAERTFNIYSAKLTDDNVEVKVDGAVEADGTAKKPEVVVTYNGQALVLNTDYKVTYSNNMRPGTATIKVTGAGNYTGTVTKTFEIVAVDMNKVTVELDPQKTEWTGEAITPAVTVTYNGKTLRKNTDYTLDITDNVEVGSAKVIVTAKSVYYTGSKEVTFDILAVDINKETVSVSVAAEDITYDGTEKKPEVVVADGKTTLVAGTDYTVSYEKNVDAGTAKAVITGKGHYSGSREITFDILAADMSKVTVEFDPQKMEWTGETVTPAVTVTYKGKTLTKDVDYTLDITDNVEVGTAKVVVTAKSANFTGSKEATFDILPVDINKKSVKVAADTENIEYAGTEKKLDITVTDGKTKLVEGKDYTVSYKNNIELGTAKAVITGKGHYSGSREITFDIIPYDLANAEIAVKTEVYVYSGKECRPEVKVVASGKTLVADKDYTVTYKDCVNTGTATARVEGTGNYTGVIEGTYDINEADMRGVDVKLSSDKFVWTGKAQMPAVKVTYNGLVLRENNDYTLTASGNVGVGTAKIVISARSENFTGSKEAVFSIQAVDISSKSVNVSVKPGSFKYDGTGKKPTIKITYGANVLSEGRDYTASYRNNVNAGTATVTITGKGSYKGTVKKTFVVTSDNIAAAKVTLGKSEYVYDGKRKTPSVKVVMNGKTLVKGQDYRVSYKNNTKAGKASVVIEGINNYTGSVAKTFVIKNMSVSITKLSSNGSKVSLTWKSAQKADRYEVYRKASDEKSYKKVASTKNASYADSSVKAGITYAYKVKAVNGSLTGVTGVSRVVVLKSIKAYAVNTTKGMQISWSKTAGAKQYKVFRKNGSSAWKTVAVTTAVKYVDRTAKNGVSYSYVVKAVATNATGAGQAVTAYRLTTEEINSISSPTKATVEVKYNRNSKATGYQVQCSLNKSFKSVTNGTANSNKKTSIRVNVAKSGARYYVRVRSYKKIGKKVYYGPWSSVSNVVVEKN